jgi:putative ABC transport system substrate-binding protein
VALPLVARAQQGDRMRRIGVLMSGDENDPEQKRRLFAFTQALVDSGWTDGHNVRVDVRLGAGGADINRIRALAQELVVLKPDIIVTNGTTPGTVAVQRDDSLNHPGGNITGFANSEATLGGKWLGLLSEIVQYMADYIRKRTSERYPPPVTDVR